MYLLLSRAMAAPLPSLGEKRERERERERDRQTDRESGHYFHELHGTAVVLSEHGAAGLACKQPALGLSCEATRPPLYDQRQEAKL